MAWRGGIGGLLGLTVISASRLPLQTLFLALRVFGFSYSALITVWYEVAWPGRTNGHRWTNSNDRIQTELVQKESMSISVGVYLEE